MALSLSSNLAHAPPINGLYSFIVQPLLYAILGSSPQLIVGPEAAGSLLVGTVVKATVESGHSSEGDTLMHAHIVGLVTCLSGAFILIAGISRLGFLDNVLSRPFLRGFITAIGFVIFVDQLIPEMGLMETARGVNHASTVEKLIFIIDHGKYAHKLTTIVAFSSFAIIMIFRSVLLSFRHKYETDIYQDIEAKTLPTIPTSRILSRSSHSSYPLSRTYLVLWMGQKRPRGPWKSQAR